MGAAHAFDFIRIRCPSRSCAVAPLRGCRPPAVPVARVQHTQRLLVGADQQHVDEAARVHHRQHIGQQFMWCAGREFLHHHVACTGGKEVGLAQPQVPDQQGFCDGADRSTCFITHHHDADLRARQPRSHFNESRVRRNGEQPRTGHCFDAADQQSCHSAGLCGRHRRTLGADIAKAGGELARSSRKGSFKLRFVHRGTSRQTALSCLIAKLKHGSTTWALVGAQATTPTRRHVVDRRGAGAHRFTVLRPLLVDDPRRDLLSHRLRLSAFKQTVLDMGVLTFALGAPGFLWHDRSLGVEIGDCFLRSRPQEGQQRIVEGQRV